MTLDQCRHWWELGEAGGVTVDVWAIYSLPRSQRFFASLNDKGKWDISNPADAPGGWDKDDGWQVTVKGPCPVQIIDGAYRVSLPNKRPLEAL